MRKKIVSVVLLLLISLSSLCFPVLADESSPTISANEVSLYPGGRATVWINAEGFGQIAAVDFGIYSSSDKIEIVSASAGGMITSQFYESNVTGESAVFSAVSAGTFDDSGTLASVSIHVADDIPAGTYYLNIAVGDVWDKDLQARTVACTPVRITVRDPGYTEPAQTFSVYANGVASHTAGDMFTVSFRSSYVSGLGTFNLVTEYDETLLSLKEVALPEKLTGAGLALWSVNSDVPGYVKTSYLSGAGVTGSINPVITYTFEVIANTNTFTAVTLEPESVYEASGRAMSFRSASASVELYETVIEPELPEIRLETLSDSNEGLTLRVKADKESAIAAGDFTVTYDRTALSCVGVTPGTTGMLVSNIQNNDGKTKFTFIFDGGIRDDTVICILEFSKINESCRDVTVGLSGKSIVNDDLDPVEAELVGTSTHVHDYEAAVTDPTCLDRGFTTHTCAVCGDSYTDDYVNALGHDYVDTVTEPTCTEQGYTTHTCSRCGHSYVDSYVAALGHDWGEWEVATDPTCTVPGVETCICTRCGETETRPVDALGHDYVATVTAPTCTEQGYTTHTCSRCGHSYTDTFVSTLGHDWSEWEVTTEPTCTEPGVETRICTRCGETETRPVDALGHDYVATVTAPTCTEQGYTTHTCSRCGDSYVDSYVSTLGHDWSEWEVTTEPTCTEPGVETRTCTRCGESETRPVNALGHDYVATVTAPTCTEQGYTTHTCSRCGHSYVDTYVPALGHNWDEWEVTTEPTCTAPGVETRICARCGETETRPVDALGHDYVATVTAPTCTEQGYTTHTCSRCGDSYVDTYVPALSHNWSEWEVTTEPTCTASGVETRTCARCGEKETRPVDALGHDYVATVTAPTCTEQGYTTHTCSRCGYSYVDTYVSALGHNWGEWEVTTDPTCTAPGVETRTCARCGETETRPVNALGHDYVATVTAPNCTEQGYTTHTCSRCGNSYVDTYVPALGHNWDEWEVTTEPTCTEPGIETRTCARCGETETRPVNALGHDYVATVTAPTCTEQGYTTHTCSRCGHSYVDTYVPALDHNWDGGVVTLSPTDTTDGLMTYTCMKCGETRTEAIPKTGTELIDTSEIFKDVKKNSWFKKAVDYVYTHGLMNGMTKDTFDPNGAMSRAMLVTVLWRAEGSPTPNGATPFTDLKAKWYKQAVAWAHECGVVKGTSATTFSPDDPVTREQIAAIFYRFAEYKNQDVSARASLGSFPDGSKVSKYAREAVSWAVADGLISGTKAGEAVYLDPKGNATRAQVATILMRYLEK